MDTAKKKKLDLLCTMGYVEALTFWGFGDFVAEERVGDVKVALRSGHPIVASARWRQRETGDKRFDDWGSFYINDRTGGLISDPNDGREHPDAKERVMAYLKQRGLGSPFTMVDVGYYGTQSKMLIGAGFEVKKTCLISSGHDLRRLRCQIPHDPNNCGFLNEVIDREKIHVPRAYKKHVMNAFGWRVFDKDIPHTENHVGLRHYERSGERVSVCPELKPPEAQSEVAAFYKGFFDGHAQIADTVGGGRPIDYGEYTRLLVDNYELLCDPNNEFTYGLRGNIAPSSEETEKGLAEWRGRVEEIYRGK